MMPRYLLTVTDENARVLEGWLGYSLRIGPNGAPDGITVAGLDAVTDEEVSAIVSRLASGSPLYHA